MSRVLICHYHLNPGGVTRIIESQVRSLMLDSVYRDVHVITGHCDDPSVLQDLGANVLINEDLNYLSSDGNDYQEKYTRIRNFFTGLIRKDDILHFHNLNLGKNPLVTAVLAELAWKGHYVLNHAHDFAEDRPKNLSFMKEILEITLKKKADHILYPQLKNYLFATLNSFDRERLISYSVDEERIILLPNPVTGEALLNGDNFKSTRQKVCEQLHINPAKILVTYPVRVIRRKNIGELIFLASYFEKEANWLVTQPPRNPLELVPYLSWKKFCIENAIPVIFEAGEKTDFEGLMRSTDFCITTSKQEGFGMAFMEPWLYGKPVIGRNISEVTRDLVSTGVEFPLLYDQLKVESHNSIVDFSTLADEEQKQCIVELKQNKAFRTTFTKLNPFLSGMLEPVKQELVEHNQTILLTEYSLENYARRLENLYQKFTH